MPSHNLQFGGAEHFDATPERVFAAAIDLDATPDNIPDLVSHERVDEHTLRAVVKPGVSFLRGTLKMEIKLVDLHPPESGTMLLNVQGIGTTITVESKMKISPEGTGARLDWQATVTQLKGLIATISPGLVQATAEKTIAAGWTRIRDRLARG